MANICDQHLHIVSATEDDAGDLLKVMAGNLEATTGIDALAGLDDGAGWEDLADALSDAICEVNGLCLISQEPDADAESGWLCAMMTEGGPCVSLNMCLKWGPSFQVAEFCAGLDPERYGCATVNGGEYVCAMGDETAFIQWGGELGVPYEGGVGYDEFVEWKAAVLASEPASLHEAALKHLFTMSNEGVFFWEAASEDEDDWEFED